MALRFSKENEIYQNSHKIGIVGAGRIGSNLAYWLTKVGWKIQGIFDIDPRNAKEAARYVPTGVYPSLEMIVKRCELLLITTPDNIIPKIAELIAEYGKTNLRVIIHSSGVLSSSILKAAGAEYSVASMHPARAFSGLDTKDNVFAEVLWAIEGEGEAVAISKQMVSSLGGSAVEILPEQKAIYHAACAMLSNNIFSILHFGEVLLKQAGLTDEQAKRAISVLSGSAVANYSRDGMKSLTGALKRGDTATIMKHLNALKPDGTVSRLYRETIVGLPNSDLVASLDGTNKKGVDIGKENN